MDTYEPAARLARFVADSPEPFFVVALDGTIVRWNTAAQRLFGIPSLRAEGRPYWTVIVGHTLAGEKACALEYAVLREARAGRTAGPVELVFNRPQLAQPVHAMVHHVMLTDRDAQPGAVLHLVEDVHERRQRERIGERLLALRGGQGGVDAFLTPRERDVFRLLVEGRTARDVAAHLGIQHATARNHIQRILAKLGARNRMEALMRALASDTLPESSTH